jgi:prepilin-type N-terminal cleavage/methylation domain-containing protein
MKARHHIKVVSNLFLRWLKSARGYSLVEMLVVIAVLGVLAGIAVHALATIREAGTIAADKRNAQELAALSVSAQALGATVIVPGDLMASIHNLTNGVTVEGQGGGPDRVFKLNLAPQEQGDASQYLSMENNQLVYRPDQ